MELRAVISTYSQNLWPLSFFDFTVYVSYTPTSKLFHCSRGEATTYEAIELQFKNDETVNVTLTERETEPELTNDFEEELIELTYYCSAALFNLGLLSEEIEARLGNIISPHEKTLLLRDWKWKLDLKFMDWASESKRVAAAFGVKGPFEFVQETERGKLYPGSSASGTAKGSLELVVIYNPSYRHFLLRGFGTRTSANITLWPDGKIQDNPIGLDYALSLAKGLYNLDLLSPEVEAALQVSITAHERLELALERQRLMLEFL